MKIELREIQKTAIKMIVDSIRQGNKHPIMAANTGFGKTILAAYLAKLCQDKGNKFWFFCNSIQLINQSAEKFNLFGIDFGIYQGDNPGYNPKATVQIASIQTIMSMHKKFEGWIPDFDMGMFDEAHTVYDMTRKIVDANSDKVIVGLTATPYSKGLGQLYSNILVPTTPKEMIDQGYQCPIIYYGGKSIDLSKVRKVDRNTYKKEDIEKLTNENAAILTGCVIDNWKEFGENSITIAFWPTQDISKAFVQKCRQNNITAEHIDCYTEPDERKILHASHEQGEFKILSCALLLNTGYDAPYVRCCIDGRPTASKIDYVQRLGRLNRIMDGKAYAIYIDHAGNWNTHGYADEILPDSLDDGLGVHDESDLIKKKKEKGEERKQQCPECKQQMILPSCRSCGYTIPLSQQKLNQLQDDGAMLEELTREEEQNSKKANKTDSKEHKTQFLSELLAYARSKPGIKKEKGWAAFQYKDKYGVWPNAIKPYHLDKHGVLASNWIKHKAIKNSKGNKK